jgi:hypothetical protein
MTGSREDDNENSARRINCGAFKHLEQGRHRK